MRTLPYLVMLLFEVPLNMVLLEMGSLIVVLYVRNIGSEFSF